MAWTKSTTTKHTCGGPAFGRLTPGCTRCDELAGGAAPVKWAMTGKREDERRSAEVRAHFASRRHLGGSCGTVCTFGEW